MVFARSGMLLNMKSISVARPWLVLAIVLAVALSGLATATLWKQHLWEPVGVRTFAYFTFGCCFLGALSLWRAPRLTRAHLLAFALLIGVALIGPGPVATVGFLLAGCSALGDAVTRLLNWMHGIRQPRGAMDSQEFAVSTFTGLALYVTFLALTAPFRIHFVVVWALLLALPLVLNGGYLKRLAAFTTQAFAPLPSISRAATLPLMVLGFGLLAHLVLIPKPEASADGLAMHLALPVRLAANHFFAYDPGAFLWSLMPMAGTFSFAIAYMLGGEVTARLLDYSLLCLIVLLLVRILRRWAPDWAAWLAAGVFVSTPIVQFVTTSLMIENAQTGFLVAAFACLLNARKSSTDSQESQAQAARSVAALLAGLLAGAALASKFGSLAVAVPIVVMASIAVPRRAWAVVALFLAIGLPPYANAWARTGNPLFPFLGNVFPSQYSNATWYIKDLRWTEKLSWRTLYDLTFHSSRFFEGYDGGLGFQSLLLLPLVLAVPYRRWPQVARLPFWIAVITAPCLLLSVPHLRYLYPMLALSTLALAIPLTLSEPRFQRAAVACAGLVWVLNLCFLPSSNFYQRDFMLNPLKSDSARVYQRNMAPSNALADYVNLVQPGAAVAALDCEVVQIARFTGPTYMSNWHSGKGRTALGLAKSEKDILRFARENGIHWFTGCRSGVSEANPNSVAQRFLQRYTTDEFTSGVERLAHLRPEFDYDREMLANGDFHDGFRGWDNRHHAVYVPSEHAVQVTDERYANQRVPVAPGGTYRITIRARCPEPDTFMRLQVNWLDTRNHEMPVSLLPVHCTPEWADYSEIFTAPPDAGSGFVFVTGHTGKPVLVQRASMAR